jgi:signal transduction histidine kinase
LPGHAVTRRILLSYLTLTLFILLALEVPLGLVYAHHERQGFAAHIERDAVVMAERAEDSIIAHDRATLTDLATQYAAETGSDVLLIDSRGRVLASTNPTADSRSPDLTAALANEHSVGYRRRAAGGSELYITVPAHTGDTVRGAVRITYDSEIVDASGTRAWWALLAGGLATLGVVAFAGFALARWLTRPVREIEAATVRIADGGPVQLGISRIGPPELRSLAVRLTDTSHRLSRILAEQKSFAAVASHQLRSPLTALRLRLENLEPMLADGAQGDLQAAIAEVDRLTRMVQGLLALSRLENSDHTGEPVDLDEVVDGGMQRWAAYAAEHRITLARIPGRLGTALAVPGAVEQILDNLLENAVRAAPPGTAIRVGPGEPAAAPGAVELHVIDHGPGLAGTDLTRAFEKFWRAPGTVSGGTGLGLSIVRQLARASGGEAHLRAHPDGGIDAVVCLRPAPSSFEDRRSMADVVRDESPLV